MGTDDRFGPDFHEAVEEATTLEDQWQAERDRAAAIMGADQQWEDFVAYTRREIVAKIADSAFVMSLVPGGDTDIKFAVELGAAIMLDKPIVALALRGRDIPPGLRRVAHAVIEIGDIDTEAGQMELRRKLEPVMAELGIGSER